MRFTNITATAEAGIVIAGCPESTIDGVVFDNVTLELVQQTEIAGGGRRLPARDRQALG